MMKPEDDLVREFEEELALGMWAAFKGLLVIVFIVVVALLVLGCSTKTYTSPEGAKITSTTFIYGPELTGLRAVDGNRTLEIEGQKSDVQQALQIIDKLAVPMRVGATLVGVPIP